MLSKVLFESHKYVVCITRAGLSVQDKQSNTGRLLPPTGRDFATWLVAFKEAIDKDESRNFCKGFLGK